MLWVPVQLLMVACGWALHGSNGKKVEEGCYRVVGMALCCEIDGTYTMLHFRTTL